MVDIIHKCIKCNKKVQIIITQIKNKKLYCASCKLKDMVDIKDKNVSYVIVQDHISIIQMNKKQYIVLHVNWKIWLMLTIENV